MIGDQFSRRYDFLSLFVGIHIKTLFPLKCPFLYFFLDRHLDSLLIKLYPGQPERERERERDSLRFETNLTERLLIDIKKKEEQELILKYLLL